MIDILVDILKDTKEKNPLIHQITNYVTVNDCANVTLAIGASPVMADEIDEVEDFVDIASSLLLNIGTINKRVKKSIKKASSKAKSINTPVILDPVGVGASKIRTSIVKELLKESKVDVLRGNISEIKSILKISSNTKGVDASKDDFDSIENLSFIAKKLSKKYKNIVAITGEVDIISDGKRAVAIKNGDDLLPKITGTGCMCSSLIASFCGTSNDKLFEATVLGILVMGIAGEIASINANKKNLGTFHKELFNVIGNFNEEILRSMAKIKVLS